MALKDYVAKYSATELLLGAAGIAVLFAIGTMFMLLIYKAVGYPATTMLTIFTILYFVWQHFHFARNPQAEDRYINDLKNSLFGRPWSKHIIAIMHLVNLGAMLALATLGWWFVLFVGVICSVIVWKQIRRAESRYYAELVVH